jgi:hypothetical protein
MKLLGNSANLTNFSLLRRLGVDKVGRDGNGQLGVQTPPVKPVQGDLSSNVEFLFDLFFDFFEISKKKIFEKKNIDKKAEIFF